MPNFKLLFNEYFDIDEVKLDKYGALNICLSADLPFFIDPFLLFASEKIAYKKLHKKVVDHLIHLKEVAIESKGVGVNKNLFSFPEIKQNWLGMSKYGNEGKGLGLKFAASSVKAFNGFYSTFGEEEITDVSHIEKLTLLNSGIGKDFISDFTTNLILDYLLSYTEKFAKKNLKSHQCKEFSVNSVFNYAFNRWTPKKYLLPYFFRETNGDFIILTPLDILTIDDAIINSSDFCGRFRSIPKSIGDSNLRESINEYFKSCLPRKPKKFDIEAAIWKTVEKFPDLIDYYIKLKEDKKGSLKGISKAKIDELRFVGDDSKLNISDEIDEMQRKYELIEQEEGSCAMISINSVGFSAAKKICDNGKLVIHGHRNGWGMLNRHPLLGIEFPAYQKIWRLAGIDQLHVNGIQNKFWESDDSVVKSIQSCLKPFVAGTELLPVVSSGQSSVPLVQIRQFLLCRSDSLNPAILFLSYSFDKFICFVF
jgi:hypothetical protein